MCAPRGLTSRPYVFIALLSGLLGGHSERVGMPLSSAPSVPLASACRLCPTIWGALQVRNQGIGLLHLCS